MPGDVWSQTVSGGFTVTSGVDRYWPITHSSDLSPGATAQADRIRASSTLTFDLAFCRITGGNRTGMLIALQVNGADSALAITTNLSGYFETSAGTTVSFNPSSDTVNWHAYGGTGGSSAMVWWQAGVRVSHASKFYAKVGAGVVTHNTASVTRYLPIGGTLLVDATQSNMQMKWPVTCPVENISAIVATNSRTTDTTFTVQSGGSDTAATLTVAGGVTGLFEATTSVTLSSGSQVNWSVVTSTGTQNLVLSNLAILCSMPAGGILPFISGAANTVSGSPRYGQPLGNLGVGSSYDANRAPRVRRVGRLVSIGARIYSLGAGTWRLELVDVAGNFDVWTPLNISTTGWLDVTFSTPPDLSWTTVASFGITRLTGSGAITFGLENFITDDPTAGGGGGGTTFTKTVTGSLSMAGAVTRLKAYKRSMAGTLSMAGSVTRLKAYKRALTGQLSMGGTVSRLKAYKRTVTGQLRFAGTLKRLQTNKRITGQLSMSGTAGKRNLKSVSGTLSMSSTLGRLKALSRPVAGVLSLSGALTRRLAARRTLTGQLQLQGVLSRRIAIRRALGGALSFAGTLTRRVTIQRALTGVLSLSSVLGRVKIPGGAVIFKTLTGVLSFGSTLTRDYIDNPEPVPGADSWLQRMRRRWHRSR